MVRDEIIIENNDPGCVWQIHEPCMSHVPAIYEPSTEIYGLFTDNGTGQATPKAIRDYSWTENDDPGCNVL